MADKVIPRPAVMRHMLHSQIKRNLAIAIGLSAIGAIAFKYSYVEPRKAAYANFYRFAIFFFML